MTGRLAKRERSLSNQTTADIDRAAEFSKITAACINSGDVDDVLAHTSYRGTAAGSMASVGSGRKNSLAVFPRK